MVKVVDKSNHKTPPSQPLSLPFSFLCFFVGNHLVEQKIGGMVGDSSEVSGKDISVIHVHPSGY